MKRQSGPHGYYNSTSVSPFGEVGILLPSCQNLSDAFARAGPSLEGGCGEHYQFLRGCLPFLHANRPLASGGNTV